MSKRKVTAEDLLSSAWAAALAEPLIQPETVPPGWLTAKQISATQKCSDVRTRAKIGALLKAGKCEMRVFRVNLGRVIRPTPHYRLLK